MVSATSLGAQSFPAYMLLPLQAPSSVHQSRTAFLGWAGGNTTRCSLGQRSVRTKHKVIAQQSARLCGLLLCFHVEGLELKYCRTFHAKRIHPQGAPRSSSHTMGTQNLAKKLSPGGLITSFSLFYFEKKNILEHISLKPYCEFAMILQVTWQNWLKREQRNLIIFGNFVLA